jgi:type II restriction/modification system DNA methylase subunit YeeA
LRAKKDLKLGEKIFEILEKEEINGRAFLKLTDEKLRSVGLALGPATVLVDFAKECEKKKLHSFSSYLSLSEVLAEYGIESNGLDSIPLFSPPTYKIQDDNEVFKRCMVEILGRMRSYGSLQDDSLEAMRNEYVVALLHAAIHIAINETKKKIIMRPQCSVVGEVSKGRTDYAIKEADELICITENKQHRVPIGFVQVRNVHY